MRGTVVTSIPSELVSATKDGVVVSTEGVYDYRLQKNQENLNLDIKEKISRLESTLETEQERAITLDEILLQSIENEVNRATMSELLLNETISNIDIYHKGEEINLNNKIDIESIRAIRVEATKANISDLENIQKIIGIYKYIDFDLPSGTLWATMNVGASSETDFGNYYMYGKGATQYTSGDSAYTGTEVPLAAAADTATQVWGEPWHMPTDEQFWELTENTNYSWETNFNGSGIDGAKLTSKTDNTKYIFLPNAGYKYNTQSSNSGRYWTSTPDDYFPDSADEVGLMENELQFGGMMRTCGLPIRPVCNNFPYKISNKADKVSNATENNFAGLDSTGNLTDSGYKVSDFLPSGNYKTTLSPVSSPNVDGSGSEFIDSISQNANGEITPHKKSVLDASENTKGLMSSSHYNKLEGIESGAEVNVLSDWNELNNSSDAFIKNKPTNVSSFNNDAEYLVPSDIEGKQDVISDLNTIREGAASGATAYLKPSGGIPSSDMSQTVLTSLGKADNAAPQSTTYTKTEVDNLISDEETRAKAAEKANADDIDAIESLIPNQASNLNQLADKDFVNSSIATATATFRGTSAANLTEVQFLAWANGLTADSNDYIFWNTKDANNNPLFKRYKYNGSSWVYEYTLNNSSFTEALWKAINSGIDDPNSAAHSVWMTDGNSDPSWRAVTVPNTIPTLDWNTESTIGTIGGKTFKVKLPSNPNTDESVTNVNNHYPPSADAYSEKAASLSGTAGAYAKDTEYTVLTGVKAQGDAAGHVTGLTYTALKIKDTNTTYKFTIGSTTKGDSTNGVSLGTLNSEAAVADGTTLSLVTTGEKAIWNAKQNALTNPVTGTGTNGYLTKWNGTNTITNGPQLSSAISSQSQSTKFLREDGTWAAPSYTTNTNTWRGIYQGGTSKLDTGTNTKALNFTGSGKTTVTFKAAGTETGQSGSTDYSTIEISSTWRGIQDNLTSSTNTTESLSAKQGYLLANGSARDDTKLPLSAGSGYPLTGDLYFGGNTYKGIYFRMFLGNYFEAIGESSSGLRIGYGLTETDNYYSLDVDIYSGGLNGRISFFNQTTRLAYIYKESNSGTGTCGTVVAKGFSTPNGTSSQFLKADGSIDENTYSLSTHNHPLSIATDDGTSELTLSHGGKYKLTAGGSTFIFTMPSDNNTTYNLTVNGTTNGAQGGTSLGTLYAVATSNTTTANQVWMRNSSNNGYEWRTLGDRAFDSTSYLPLSGGTISAGSVYSLYLNNSASGATLCGLRFQVGGTTYGGLYVSSSDSALYYNGYKVWHTNNDGSGSGLDADLLDGQHGSYYMKRGSAQSTTDPTLYYKVATASFDTGAASTHDTAIALAVTSYYGYGNGILTASFRKNANTSVDTNQTYLRWVCRDKEIPSDKFILTYKVTDSGAKSTINLYIKLTKQWQDYRISMLDEGGWYSFKSKWTLYNVRASAAVPAIPSDETQVACTDNTMAGKLSTSRTLWGRPFDGTANVSGALSGVTSIEMSSALYIANANSILFKDSGGTYRTTLGVDSSNNLVIGYGMASAEYNTFIDGNTLSLRYGKSHTTGIYLNASGNVGIGTTSPTSKLDVNGTVNTKGVSAHGPIQIFGNRTVNSETYEHDLVIHNNIAYTTDTSAEAATARDAKSFAYYAYEGGTNRIGHNPLVFGASAAGNTGALCWTGNKNYTGTTNSYYWGINTWNPLYQLEVGGTFGAKTMTITSTTGEGHLVFNRGAYNYIRCSATSGSIGFIVNGQAVSQSNYALFINSNGNIGIGSYQPSYKLHVAGTLNTENNIYVKGKTIFDASTYHTNILDKFGTKVGYIGGGITCKITAYSNLLLLLDNTTISMHDKKIYISNLNSDSNDSGCDPSIDIRSTRKISISSMAISNNNTQRDLLLSAGTDCYLDLRGGVNPEHPNTHRVSTLKTQRLTISNNDLLRIFTPNIWLETNGGYLESIDDRIKMTAHSSQGNSIVVRTDGENEIHGRTEMRGPITRLLDNCVTSKCSGGYDAGSGNNRYHPSLWVFNTKYSPKNGDMITIKIPSVGGHNYGVWLSIEDGSNYHPIMIRGSRLDTHYSAGDAITLIYLSDAKMPVGLIFPIDGGTSRNTSEIPGNWRVLNVYNSDNYHAVIHTAADTAAKTATAPWYSLRTHNTFTIYNRYTNTAASALTLNVNDTGAKPLYINGNASSSSNYTLPAGTYFVYYNGTNYYVRTDGIIPITAEKALSTTSDIRLKNIFEYIDNIKVEDISQMPIVRYFLKSERDKLYIGSIALNWKTILPEIVTEDSNGYLGMQYDIAALTSSIITARKVVNHEEKIKQLEEEIKNLKELIIQFMLNEKIYEKN